MFDDTHPNDLDDFASHRLMRDLRSAARRCRPLAGSELTVVANGRRRQSAAAN